MDYEENDKINYTEFLSAAINPKRLRDEKILRGVFNIFDLENTGKITVENMV